MRRISQSIEAFARIRQYDAQHRLHNLLTNKDRTNILSETYLSDPGYILLHYDIKYLLLCCWRKIINNVIPIPANFMTFQQQHAPQ